MRTLRAGPNVAKMSRSSILWFRRDLRLSDHPALASAAAAATGSPVLGLFVIDPALWEPAGDVRRSYLLASLRALDEGMGGRLVVRLGDPAIVVPRVAAEAGADTIFISADFGPYGHARDVRVSEELAKDGRALQPVGAPYAVAPGTIRKADASPYRVYTPFYRAWADHGWARPQPMPPLTWLDAASDPWPTVHIPDGLVLPTAGEPAALERWQDFLEGALTDYADHRDRPDMQGTSSLSAALRWGEIHPRTLLESLGDARGHEVFRKELCWREFYADVLHHTPTSARVSLRHDIGTMRVDAGPDASLAFEAWTAGRTGFPFVDAGMRQLRAEGWMHNRVRMVVASFLVKDLHLPWQQGAAHFMAWLRDADLASNQHGWQWTAGTGTDAAPYFRVFNPITQGLRFDPNGDYVRQYIPELAMLTGADAHQPWLSPLMAGDYPERIVDHAVERNESLARLAEATGKV